MREKRKEEKKEKKKEREGGEISNIY